MRPPFLPLLLALLLAAPVRAKALPAADPGQQCRAAIAAAERSFGIPGGLMAAIARIESGRRGPDGRVDPWPWSIDAEGNGRTFETKTAAMAAIRALQAAGVRSIDVGCMQVNLLHHPDAFPTLDAAFDPTANVAYAARFLSQLHAQTGSWPEAAALYHSATPALAAEYRRKVMEAWPAELAQAGTAPAVWAPVAPSMGGIAAGGTLPARTLLRGGPRLIPLTPGRTGRRLADYRAAPIPLAIRVVAPPHGRG
jgi:hypothetical protein